MFDVGYSELLVIAVVLIVVVGPKDLPKMLRAFGKAMARFRKVSGEFRRQFDDALKEAELDDVKKVLDSARNLDPRKQIRDALNPLTSAVNDIKRDVMTPKMAPGQVIPTVADMVAKPVVEPMEVPAPKKTRAKPVAKVVAAKIEAMPVAAKSRVKKTIVAEVAPPTPVAKPKKKAVAKS